MEGIVHWEMPADHGIMGKCDSLPADIWEVV